METQMGNTTENLNWTQSLQDAWRHRNGGAAVDTLHSQHRKGGTEGKMKKYAKHKTVHGMFERRWRKKQRYCYKMRKAIFDFQRYNGQVPGALHHEPPEGTWGLLRELGWKNSTSREIGRGGAQKVNHWYFVVIKVIYSKWSWQSRTENWEWKWCSMKDTKPLQSTPCDLSTLPQKIMEKK